MFDVETRTHRTGRLNRPLARNWLAGRIARHHRSALPETQRTFPTDQVKWPAAATRATENIPSPRHRVKTTRAEQSIKSTFSNLLFVQCSAHWGPQPECKRTRWKPEAPDRCTSYPACARLGRTEAKGRNGGFNLDSAVPDAISISNVGGHNTKSMPNYDGQFLSRGS